MNHSDLLRRGPDQHAELIDDLGDGSLLWMLAKRLNLAIEVRLIVSDQMALHRPHEAINTGRLTLVVNDGDALEFLLIPVDLYGLIVEFGRSLSALNVNLHVVRRANNCLVMLHPDVCDFAFVSDKRVAAQRHSFSVEEEDFARLRANSD